MYPGKSGKATPSKVAVQDAPGVRLLERQGHLAHRVGRLPLRQGMVRIDLA
jgi:hypothetical protein